MGRKILEMSSSFLLDFFREGQNLHYEIAEKGLPGDACVIGAYFDISNGILQILVESQEWPPTPEGSYYSRFSPTVRTFHDRNVFEKSQAFSNSQ